MKKIGFLSILFSILVMGFAQPSWAWRGGYYGGGWHGGWGGPRVGVYLGGPYDPYYDPYYYPGPYAYPAAYPAYPVDPNAGLVPDNPPPAANSNGNDQPSAAQISRQRAQLDYDYADGDITKAQYDASIAQLQRAAQQPPQQAVRPAASEPAEKTEPSSSVQGFARVSDLHLELTTLLDQKLKDGDITRAQHDSEINYLNQIKSQAHDDASANNGRLTGEQENTYVQQLHQAYYAINHNLITH